MQKISAEYLFNLPNIKKTVIKKKIEKCPILSVWGKISGPSLKGAKNKYKEIKNRI